MLYDENRSQQDSQFVTVVPAPGSELEFERFLITVEEEEQKGEKQDPAPEVQALVVCCNDRLQVQPNQFLDKVAV